MMTPNPYTGKDAGQMKVQTIRGTGAVHLYGPEIDIVDTPEFQRLGGIKQLGTSYFVFRGAVHTRFEHSLGALQEAQNIVDAVNRNAANRPTPAGRAADARRVDARGTRLARLGALLHDLPHVPFGHTLEDEFNLLMRHDDNTPRLRTLLVESRIGDILRDRLPTDELDDLLLLLRATPAARDLPDDAAHAAKLGDYAYVADIVANTVCADVLDYIVRDLSACGMPVAIGTRFLDHFEITPTNLPIAANCRRLALRLDKRGMPRPDVESEVLKLLTYRYELAERVFFHHAKNAASVMIGEAVSLLELHQRDANFHWLSDDVLLAALARPRAASALGLKITGDAERRELAAELGAMIEQRRLYKLAYLGVADDDVSLKASDLYAQWGRDPSARRELEAELAARAGLRPGRVLVHLPAPQMMMKLAKVRVLLDEDTVTTFEDWEARHSDRVRALNRAHARLWRLGVYLHPEDFRSSSGAARLVHSAARDMFDLPSRYAQVEVDEPYLATVYDLYAAERRWSIADRAAHLRRAARAAATADEPLSLQAAIETLDNTTELDAAPSAAIGDDETQPRLT